ncbi:MAG: hypothetical protein ACE5EE_07100 [Fidelibacterota bacterium]
MGTGRIYEAGEGSQGEGLGQLTAAVGRRQMVVISRKINYLTRSKTLRSVILVTAHRYNHVFHYLNSFGFVE